MLSAFHPQAIVELKKQDKSRIECILAYGDRILIGLSTGDLRIFRVVETAAAAAELSNATNADHAVQTGKGLRRPVELLREVEGFARKSPQQLAIIKESNILVSLSDGYVCFHDLQTFVLSDRLEQTKGATTFAVTSNVVRDTISDINSIVSRLAVAVKRKILIWAWQDMELNEAPSELTLAAPIKSLCWMTGTRLVAGMDLGYVLIDIDSQFVKEISHLPAAGEASNAVGTRFGAVNSSSMGYMGMGSWVPKPLASKLTQDHMLLAKDVNSLFIDVNGDPLEKRQLPWAAAPEAIGYSYPYILALHPSTRGILEVRNPHSLSLLQSIPLPKANLLHVPQPYISLAHAGKGFLVANERCIWRMNAVSYSEQIKDLLALHKFDEATSLVGLLEDTLLLDKYERLREIKIQKAEDLFNKQKYGDAMGLFIEASAPPQRVIARYPETIAGSFGSRALPHDQEHREERADGDTSSQGKSEKPKPGELSVDGDPTAAAALRDSDETSVRSTITYAASDKDQPVQVSKPTGRFETDDLLNATKALFGFLAHTRKQLQRYINFDGTMRTPTTEHVQTQAERPPYADLVVTDIQNTKSVDWSEQLLQTAIAVDTTLFRAYMHASPRLAGSLFRIDNFCAPEVVEEKLYESGNYVDLIDFLHGKRLHRQALELLEKLGKSESDAKVSQPLQGPQRTVAYLQQLPPEEIDTILRFATWPIENDPRLGMQIFTADTNNAESLPRDKVLEFLQGIGPGLTIQYLEHIIEELNDSSTIFHEHLIELYLSSLQDKRVQPTDDLQSKLETFLRRRSHFDSGRMLNEVPDDDPVFYEARAILHSKLAHHLQALEIYVFQVGSPSKAETYCNAAYLASSSSAPSGSAPEDSVYTTLLSLFLNPPSPHTRDLFAALDLLSRHGSRIPALSTLNFLPADLPIEKLKAYFRGRMRAANSIAREAAMTRALAGVEKARVDIKLQIGNGDDDASDEHANAGASLERGQNRRTVLSDERMCSGCHKRFGRAAVRVWPSGEIRHYGCGEPRNKLAGVTDATTKNRPLTTGFS